MLSKELLSLLTKSSNLIFNRDSIENEVFCNKCDSILLNVYSTDCKHNFCQKCTEEIFSSLKKLCPLDGININNLLANHSILDKILMLELKCPRNQNGCCWTGNLNDLEYHFYSLCGYTFVACENDCGNVFQKNKLAEHMKKECPKKAQSFIINNHQEVNFEIIENENNADYILINSQLDNLRLNNEDLKKENYIIKANLYEMSNKLKEYKIENSNLKQKNSEQENFIKKFCVSAAGVNYSLIMSSRLTGLGIKNSYEALVSDDLNEGVATNNMQNQFIKCIFPYPVFVSKITLGEYLPWGSEFLKGCSLQYSKDDVEYETLFEIKEINSNSVTYNIDPVFARYFKLYRNSNYIALSILRFE